MSTTLEISSTSFGEPSTLKTGIEYKIVQVLSPLEQIKPWSIKLSIALLSRRASMEWSSPVSMVLSSTVSCREVLCASNALAKS